MRLEEHSVGLVLVGIIGFFKVGSHRNWSSAIRCPCFFLMHSSSLFSSFSYPRSSSAVDTDNLEAWMMQRSGQDDVKVRSSLEDDAFHLEASSRSEVIVVPNRYVVRAEQMHHEAEVDAAIKIPVYRRVDAEWMCHVDALWYAECVGVLVPSRPMMDDSCAEADVTMMLKTSVGKRKTGVALDPSLNVKSVQGGTENARKLKVTSAVSECTQGFHDTSPPSDNSKSLCPSLEKHTLIQEQDIVLLQPWPNHQLTRHSCARRLLGLSMNSSRPADSSRTVATVVSEPDVALVHAEQDCSVFGSVVRSAAGSVCSSFCSFRFSTQVGVEALRPTARVSYTDEIRSARRGGESVCRSEEIASAGGVHQPAFITAAHRTPQHGRGVSDAMPQRGNQNVFLRGQRVFERPRIRSRWYLQMCVNDDGKCVACVELKGLAKTLVFRRRLRRWAIIQRFVHEGVGGEQAGPHRAFFCRSLDLLLSDPEADPRFLKLSAAVAVRTGRNMEDEVFVTRPPSILDETPTVVFAEFEPEPGSGSRSDGLENQSKKAPIKAPNPPTLCTTSLPCLVCSEMTTQVPLDPSPARMRQSQSHPTRSQQPTQLTPDVVLPVLARLVPGRRIGCHYRQGLLADCDANADCPTSRCAPLYPFQPLYTTSSDSLVICSLLDILCHLNEDSRERARSKEDEGGQSMRKGCCGTWSKENQTRITYGTIPDLAGSLPLREYRAFFHAIQPERKSQKPSWASAPDEEEAEDGEERAEHGQGRGGKHKRRLRSVFIPAGMLDSDCHFWSADNACGGRAPTRPSVWQISLLAVREATVSIVACFGVAAGPVI
ncbi:uncharacterized protein MYCFIDRAFT_179704 [Pseudocercospora fijiensis CIRAD86]|uniref:Uncharacterized protein n=1 Tax=Pseudocercospora fijiensis (strain CIRAD86) TaxID=383855 RepID=M2YI93_PSEFD|nr:uncharacterized protein MYCFIDRAFT_179704 [Pseudocercospora fijiensis CIRAD86]EME77490.1 hypothetical protein MYCFIDRAFT_179704 [Pseudocercospora fijiensis CIRAD86]